jgi:large subunit ribosomal protein L19
MNLIQKYNSKKSVKIVPDIKPGMTVKVHQKIKEGDKSRVQVFEGIVISRKHGSGPASTITVRKIASGVGVERIFPLHSPNVEKFEIVKTSKIRRAKLYYLRGKTAKETRKKTKILSDKKENGNGIETATIEESSKEE